MFGEGRSLGSLVERFRRLGCARPVEDVQERSVEFWFLRFCKACDFFSLSVSGICEVRWAEILKCPGLKFQSTSAVVAQQREATSARTCHACPAHLAPLWTVLPSCSSGRRFVVSLSTRPGKKTSSRSGSSVFCPIAIQPELAPLTK